MKKHRLIYFGMESIVVAGVALLYSQCPAMTIGIQVLILRFDSLSCYDSHRLIGLCIVSVEESD